MKSTFQKPDATYPHGSLREQPENEKREIMKIDLELIRASLSAILADYHKLPKEDIMSSVKKIRNTVDLMMEEQVAVPMVQETEDELWDEMYDEMDDYLREFAFALPIGDVALEVIKKLKSKFTIKRKTS